MGSYCLWEWGGRTVSPFPTSTLHPRPHACPACSVLLTRLFIVPMVHSLHSLFTHSPQFWVCWFLTHRFWMNLVSRRHFVPLHELLLTFTQGIVAVTHAQPISRPFSCCCSPTSPGRAVHSSRGLIVSLTHGKFWVFPRLLAVSFSLIWDCCFPCVLWVVVFNFVLCHYGFPIH